MKPSLKFELSYSFCESFVIDIEQRFLTQNYSNGEKLLMAVMAEVKLLLKQKMLAEKTEFKIKFNAIHAIAIHDYYMKFVANYTTHYGINMMQIANKINQHYA